MFCYTNEGMKNVRGTLLFLGDSITNDGSYITYINGYLKLFQPEASIQLYNLGVSSETVSGLSEPAHPFPRPCLIDRLDRITASIKADWAILSYGINDAIYYPFHEERLRSYLEGMETVVNALKQKGIKICILTPSPFDADCFQGTLMSGEEKEFSYMTPYQGYDEVMRLYGEALIRHFEGKAEHIIDIYRPIHQDWEQQREVHPAYQSGDGIHPGRHGHFIIAQTILREMMNVNISSLEEIMERQEGAWWELFRQKDMLYHSYYKETIGHDNPFKDEILPLPELEKEILRLDDKIKDRLENCPESMQLISEYHGCKRTDFYFLGYEVIVVAPENPVPGNTWVWRTEFFDAFPYADIAMLRENYYLVHIKLSNQYGAPNAIDTMKKFHDMVTDRFHLCSRAVLFGFSRGGLYALHYAAAYSQDVSLLYLDAPVVDIYSWPAKGGNGTFVEWRECCQAWELGMNERDSFAAVVKKAACEVLRAAIPLLLVAGDTDEIVPYEENGMILAQMYEKTEVSFRCILKKGCGHHPHSLENPEDIVRFIMDYHL